MRICILIYEDDIVLVSENEQNLQTMLDSVNTWCYKWQMKVNAGKIKVVHFRNKRETRTSSGFKKGDSEIDLVDGYRYLGIFFDEFF